MSRLSSVLLVDDDATANFLNKLVLQRVGISGRVLVAEDGAQALRVLADSAAEYPALILLDLNMPVMNGLEFLQAYQLLPEAQRRGVVVMLLTSALLARDIDQLRDLPVSGTLEKPLTVTKLQQVLEEHFPA